MTNNSSIFKTQDGSQDSKFHSRNYQSDARVVAQTTMATQPNTRSDEQHFESMLSSDGEATRYTKQSTTKPQVRRPWKGMTPNSQDFSTDQPKDYVDVVQHRSR